MSRRRPVCCCSAGSSGKAGSSPAPPGPPGTAPAAPTHSLTSHPPVGRVAPEAPATGVPAHSGRQSAENSEKKPLPGTLPPPPPRQVEATQPLSKPRCARVPHALWWWWWCLRLWCVMAWQRWLWYVFMDLCGGVWGCGVGACCVGLHPNGLPRPFVCVCPRVGGWVAGWQGDPVGVPVPVGGQVSRWFGRTTFLGVGLCGVDDGFYFHLIPILHVPRQSCEPLL